MLVYIYARHFNVNAVTNADKCDCSYSANFTNKITFVQDNNWIVEGGLVDCLTPHKN